MEVINVKSRRFVKATIYDVARRADVSITTVSHYLRGRKGACSSETAARIEASIGALQYVPGLSAGRARDRATHTIGLCLESENDIADNFDSRQTYHERVVRAIGHVADERTYALLRYPAKMRLGETANFFLDGRVDGVLLDLGFDPSSIEAAAAVMPIVLVNRNMRIPLGCGAICTNEDDTLRLAIDHLTSLGHRRIALLSAPMWTPVEGCVESDMLIVCAQAARVRNSEALPSDVGTRRCAAYIRQMRRLGAFEPTLIGCIGSWGDTHTEGTDEQLDRWLSLPEPPTAIIGASDPLALGMLTAIKARGLSCPHDISVVGIDNRTAASEFDPPLTTVDVPAEAVGRGAMDLLLRMLSVEELPLDEMVIQLPVTQLVARASTAACRQENC